MPTTQQSKIEKLEEKLPVEYQATVNDLFTEVTDVVSDSRGVHVNGYLAEGVKFSSYRSGESPYYISYIKKYKDNDTFITLTFRPGVEI